METKYFSLGSSDNNRLVKIIRIFFGIVCFGISIFWLIFNLRSITADKSLWVTIIFLAGFGVYQVLAGLGRTACFIEIGAEKIRLKKNSVLPYIEIKAADINKIEIFPLNLIIYPHTGKRTVLRFGTTFTDNIEPIKSEVELFANLNNIACDIKTEEILS